MLEKSILTYPILILLSIGRKNFTNMGKTIEKSGDTVSRFLLPAEQSQKEIQKISQKVFGKAKKLFLSIDDTLIKKFYASQMQGSGSFYDTQVGRRITAFRLIVGMISDGKIALPLQNAYLFSKELVEHMDGKVKSKDDLAKAFVRTAMKLFPGKEIIVLADGLYTTVNFLTWCKQNGIATQMRMHSNRSVVYKGKKKQLKALLNDKGIMPKGRQMCRTITVTWHSMSLEITIVRRFDKKDNETIVFQVATYKALPREHVAHYKKRWPIEKCFRTSKQTLGIGECYSTSLTTQHNHVSASFLAYALAQLEMKKRRCKTPEEAVRRCKTKTATMLIDHFTAMDAVFH